MTNEGAGRGSGLCEERDALAGLLGWAQMLLAAEDMPPKLRSRFADNHRLTTAVLALAAPVKVRPLTDEAITALWSWSMLPEAERTATTQQHAFARAVERAHGIEA